MNDTTETDARRERFVALRAQGLGRDEAYRRSTETDAGLRDAVDRASAVFGWQHLARYSGMSAEWLDTTLTAIVRAARVHPPGGCGICGKPLDEVGTSRCYEAHVTPPGIGFTGRAVSDSPAGRVNPPGSSS